jgi:hypothetical protein
MHRGIMHLLPLSHVKVIFACAGLGGWEGGREGRGPC